MKTKFLLFAGAVALIYGAYKLLDHSIGFQIDFSDELGGGK